MKFPFFAALLLCCGLPALAQDVSHAQVIEKIDWSAEELADLNRTSPVGYSFSVGGNHLLVDKTPGAQMSVTLHTLGTAITSQVTSKHYAIVGQTWYDDVGPGSYLEMWSYFAPATPGAPEGAYFSRTMADSGPMAKLDGSVTEPREFVLPFDATGLTTKLVRLQFNLHLGSGHIHLVNVRLVQFPDASTDTPSPPAPAASSPAPAPTTSFAQIAAQTGQENTNALKAIWFCLGAAATGLTLLIASALVFAFRLWQRRHHERELRRIASLDT